jgi:hypothetical protein
MRMRRQSGEGVLGCVVWLVLAGIATLILVKMVPVKIASSELLDFMTEQAKFAGRHTTSDAVKKAILNKAVQLGLPVTAKDIGVQITGGRIIMRCTYAVPVDLVFYTYVWQFDHRVNRPVFIV